MNLDKAKAWLRTHRKQAALGAAAIAVTALALYRRRAAGRANSQGLAVGFQPQETSDGSFEQFTGALGQLADQQQAQSDALAGAIGQIGSNQQDGMGALYDAMAANTQAQNQATAGLIDQLQAGFAGLTEPQAAAAPRPAGNTQGTYTFGGGDTIGGVAAKYGVTVPQLLGANSASGKNFDAPGHTITVPTAAAPVGKAPDVRYVFKPGESYATVAKQFGLTEAQLRAQNPTAGKNSGKVGTAITIKGK